eukprot:1161036-Pelagomonas_calceolata.AAC.5
MHAAFWLAQPDWHASRPNMPSLVCSFLLKSNTPAFSQPSKFHLVTSGQEHRRHLVLVTLTHFSQ